MNPFPNPPVAGGEGKVVYRRVDGGPLKAVDPWSMAKSLCTPHAPKLVATQTRGGCHLTVTAQDQRHFEFLQSVTRIGPHAVEHLVHQ